MKKLLSSALTIFFLGGASLHSCDFVEFINGSRIYRGNYEVAKSISTFLRPRVDFENASMGAIIQCCGSLRVNGEVNQVELMPRVFSGPEAKLPKVKRLVANDIVAIEVYGAILDDLGRDSPYEMVLDYRKMQLVPVVDKKLFEKKNRAVVQHSIQPSSEKVSAGLTFHAALTELNTDKNVKFSIAGVGSAPLGLLKRQNYKNKLTVMAEIAAELDATVVIDGHGVRVDIPEHMKQTCLLKFLNKGGWGDRPKWNETVGELLPSLRSYFVGYQKKSDFKHLEKFKESQLNLGSAKTRFELIAKIADELSLDVLLCSEGVKCVPREVKTDADISTKILEANKVDIQRVDFENVDIESMVSRLEQLSGLKIKYDEKKFAQRNGKIVPKGKVLRLDKYMRREMPLLEILTDLAGVLEADLKFTSEGIELLPN